MPDARVNKNQRWEYVVFLETVYCDVSGEHAILF